MRRPQAAEEGEPALATIGFRSIFLAQLGRLLDALAGRAPYVTHVEAGMAVAEPPNVAAVV